MSVRDILVVYGLLGLACAVAVIHRAEVRGAATVASALAALLLWPLWAPFALAPARRRGDDEVVRRVERALAEAVEAARGTAMSELFNEATARRVAAEVTRVAGRLRELRALADDRSFDLEASARRLAELEASGASERTVATARMQHGSLERLARLRASDTRALVEVAELLEALRTQLVLSRLAGSNADSATEMVSEVWCRLEGLGAALDGPP